ncbi:hypothetical protein RI129_004867 [Pyrocoelia pectoralis]|uniref:SH2 domain-containing protein n=1 Tax=Pyrocoelia pectoralis TaxID=417401 RepID=A0AAN7ZR46_9COLE
MDSGISSAGHQQNAHTNASTSPPLTAQPSPLTPEDQHRELDELLTDMMLTVQSIPDVKPRQSPSVTNGSFNLEHVKYIDEEEDKNIPYHARQDSRPFSYGVNSSMINESKGGLSSPSLVRKASFNKSSGDTLKKVQTQVFPDSSYSSYPTYSTYNTSKYGTYSTTSSYNKKDPIDEIFTVSILNTNHQPYRREYREEYYKDEGKKYETMKRSLTDGSLRRAPEKIHEYKTSSSLVASPLSDGENLSPPGAFRTSPRSPEFHETYTTSNLTWLQKQQLKLKERREMQLRDERQPHETRLLSELRNIQARHIRPSASHRADGYTSDTTAFADDDEDFTVPLHINTMSRNVSSINSPPSGNTTMKTVYSTNERPFVAVKRIHEKFVQNSTSPSSALAENPMGHAIRSPSRGGPDSTDGLLSLVEQEQYFKQSPHPSTSPLVGISNSYKDTETQINKSSHGNSCIMNDNSRVDSSRHDALADLIASLSNGSDNSNDSPNSANAWQYRDESISSWRTQSVSEMESSPPHSVSPRPQTPAFPVHPRTPYTNASTPTVQFDLPSERLPPKSPTTQRKDRPISPSDLSNGTMEYSHTVLQRSTSATPTNYNYKENFSDGYQHSPVHNGSASPTVYYVNSRRSSAHSESPQEVSPAHVKFVRDTSKYWYKPTITREEAICLLRNQSPGTFVVRDSNSFPGAFGLALKVATLPSNVQTKSPSSDEYVRHFLIEPTSRGVRLKGCSNEPVFSSLSALIYQHSVTQMALPCRLMLPEGDVKQDNITTSSQAWLSQGAACNVLYLFSLDMESLTGPQAVRKTVIELFQKSPLPTATVVHIKVNGQGITLTDHKRKVFFRRHYPINTISYFGVDPDEHRWSVGNDEEGIPKSSNKIFGFVARKPASNADNQCHLFAELEPEQPATAIVNFVNKMLNASGTKANIV